MNRYLLITASTILCFSGFAQPVQYLSSPPTAYLQINLDAAKLAGSCNLATVDTVYMYSGADWLDVTNQDSIWGAIVGQWGVDDGVGKMTSLGNRQFSICINVNEYYTELADPDSAHGGAGFGPLPPGGTVYNIGMIFRQPTCPFTTVDGKIVYNCTDPETGKDENCRDFFLIGVNTPLSSDSSIMAGDYFNRPLSPGLITARYVPGCGAQIPLFVQITGSDTICTGGSTELTAYATGGGGTYVYNWSTGSTAQIITVNTTGTYKVTVTDQNMNVFVDSVLVVNGNPVTPTVRLSVSDSSLVTCNGMPVTFTATSVNGGNSPVYNFIVDGTGAQNSSSANYTTANLANGDSVICIMTSNSACAQPALAASNTITMTVKPGLQPVIVQNGDSLTTTAAYNSYQWFLNGNLINQANLPWYVATQSGNYTVVVTDSNGCSGTSATVSITQCIAFFMAIPEPEDTGVYIVYDQSTGNNLQYIWYFGDGDSSTLQYPVHKYDTAGYYDICLTVYNNICTNTYCDSTFYAWKYGAPMSQLIVNNPTGITQISESPSLNVFPNPSSHSIFIVTSNFHAAQITIYDMEGQQVLQQKFTPKIDISVLNPGIYLVEVTGTEGKVIKRLEKL